MFPRQTLRALALAAALGACDENPAEVKNDSAPFELRVNWASSVAAIGTSGLNGSLTVKQFSGFRIEAKVTVTAPLNRTYQWRIFRGNCATTVAAASNTDPNGLLLFATVQSYPDVATGASGSATLTREVAGTLDSLSAYSIRFRTSQSATNWNGTSPVACGNLVRSP